MITLREHTIIRAPMARCFDLARSVEVHLAGNTHWGETAVAIGGVTAGLIGMGESVTWQARHFGVRQRLTSKITALERPAYFQDTMLRGAFRSMHHDHFFRSVPPATPGVPAATEMIDVFTFAAPLGWLGRIAEIILLERYMRSLLRERNDVLCQIAESSAWQSFLSPVERA